MKGLIITSWILIGLVVIGSLMNLVEGLLTGDDVLGLAVFAFYGALTYRAQQLIK